MSRIALRGIVIGSCALIAICTVNYLGLNNATRKLEPWSISGLDNSCFKTRNPGSWQCYRAEVSRQNVLLLFDMGMRGALIAAIAVTGLAAIQPDQE